MRRYRRKRKRIPKIFYTLNQNISAENLRVISPEGENLGVLDRNTALKKAAELELDLILIAEKAKPPVAKILDFKKFLYEKRKEQKQARKGNKQETKEFRIGPNISASDLDQRIERIIKFLKHGDKIKLTVQFRGRMITRSRFGKEKLDKVYQAVQAVNAGEYEKEPFFEGKRLMAIIQPK